MTLTLPYFHSYQNSNYGKYVESLLIIAQYNSL